MEALKRTDYQYKDSTGTKEFIIQEKDYGELIVFDIFFEDRFLFTVAQDGKVIFSNWEAAKRAPVNMDEQTLNEMTTYILNQKT